MKKKLKNKRKLLYIILSVILTLIIVLLFFKIIIKNDGMEQSGINDIKYRTYSKKTGWSKWSKNGLTSGNFNDSISSIEIKINGNAGFLYSLYTSENGWTEMSESLANATDSYDTIKSDNNIKAIKFALFYDSSRKFDLCYRTYNKKNKWLEWNCDIDGISGNKKEDITAIQMKMIPDNVVKNEYLKDYNLNVNKKNIGF